MAGVSAHLAGPLLLTAPHGKEVWREGTWSQVPGITGRRLHRREEHTTELVLKLALLSLDGGRPSTRGHLRSAARTPVHRPVGEHTEDHPKTAPSTSKQQPTRPFSVPNEGDKADPLARPRLGRTGKRPARKSAAVTAAERLACRGGGHGCPHPAAAPAGTDEGELKASMIAAKRKGASVYAGAGTRSLANRAGGPAATRRGAEDRRGKVLQVKCIASSRYPGAGDGNSVGETRPVPAIGRGAAAGNGKAFQAAESRRNARESMVPDRHTTRASSVTWDVANTPLGRLQDGPDPNYLLPREVPVCAFHAALHAFTRRHTPVFASTGVASPPLGASTCSEGNRSLRTEKGTEGAPPIAGASIGSSHFDSCLEAAAAEIGVRASVGKERPPRNRDSNGSGCSFRTAGSQVQLLHVDLHGKTDRHGMVLDVGLQAVKHFFPVAYDSLRSSCERHFAALLEGNSRLRGRFSVEFPSLTDRRNGLWSATDTTAPLTLTQQSAHLRVPSILLEIPRSMRRLLVGSDQLHLAFLQTLHSIRLDLPPYLPTTACPLEHCRHHHQASVVVHKQPAYSSVSTAALSEQLSHALYTLSTLDTEKPI
ncbi:hypothetical protein DIPPA_04142 [Diplonema papillatum]|nr:hypothetical protein DIPPA_04142 [Diplonema papillatum]